MTLDEMAAHIRVSAQPISRFVAASRADGGHATIWGPVISALEYLELQRLCRPAANTPEEQARRRALAAHDRAVADHI